MHIKHTILLAAFFTMALLIGLNIGIADTATGQATISNAAPSVGTVTLFNQAGANAAITLTAGSTVNVFCNATLTDSNGYSDIDNATATLYHSSSSSGASDDENIHYTNSSCSLGTNTSVTDVPVTCYFTLNYMATNGTWTCNITANDGTTTASATGTNTINTLAGLDVPESSIDFGTMSLGSNSSSAELINITNTGNVQIDAQFSGTDYSCTIGSIPVGNTKYNLSSLPYDNMTTSLTSSAVTQTSFDLGVRGVATSNGVDSKKNEYWTILIPSTGVGGTCNNTITVTAIAG